MCVYVCIYMYIGYIRLNILFKEFNIEVFHSAH